MEKGLTKIQIVTELTRVPHGNLSEFVPVAHRAAAEDPEFLAHLIAWNHLRGQVRDSKVALPVVALGVPQPADLAENALAHLALLGPRELARAVRFAKAVKTAGAGRKIRRHVARYLKVREARLDRVAVQHRATLRELYALSHLKPGEHANIVLFGRSLDKTPRPYPRGSVFEAVKNLKNMAPAEAAGTILQHKIPFLIARGAMGKRMAEPDVLMALIDRMTPTELVTNAKALESLGMKNIPAVRAAFEQALARAATSKKNTFKATRAVESLEEHGESPALVAKMRAVQEKQIDALGGVEGNWLVLGDKSGSMSACIETARQVAAVLARMVKGKVHLVFFDVLPRHIDATGRSYEEILDLTRHVTASGGTSIGCGLRMALEKGLEVDGIAIVSDGAENRPPLFRDVYTQTERHLGKQPPIYFYRVGSSFHPSYGDLDLAHALNGAHIEFQEFPLGYTVDYYALPNLVSTMRVNRYGLVEEIMATPLVTLADVFEEAVQAA